MSHSASFLLTYFVRSYDSFMPFLQYSLIIFVSALLTFPLPCKLNLKSKYFPLTIGLVETLQSNAAAAR